MTGWACCIISFENWQLNLARLLNPDLFRPYLTSTVYVSEVGFECSLMQGVSPLPSLHPPVPLMTLAVSVSFYPAAVHVTCSLWSLRASECSRSALDPVSSIQRPCVFQCPPCFHMCWHMGVHVHTYNVRWGHIHKLAVFLLGLPTILLYKSHFGLHLKLERESMLWIWTQI